MSKPINTSGKPSKPIEHIRKNVISVQLKDLVPANFQRKIKDNIVREIADNFQMSKYTYPCVARAENGKYIVWDGQHRVAALRLLYSEESTIEVYLDDIGYEQAAREFAEQDERKQSVTTVQKFKALVEANDSVSVEVNNIVTSLGLAFGQGAPVVKIGAVKDTVSAYEKLGKQRFENMLIVMRDGLPQDDNMWKSVMIKAMTKFFETYVGNNIDNAHLKEALSKFYLQDELKTAISVSPKDKISGLVYCIARSYNKNKRGSARLDTRGLIPEKA